MHAQRDELPKEVRANDFLDVGCTIDVLDGDGLRDAQLVDCGEGSLVWNDGVVD